MVFFFFLFKKRKTFFSEERGTKLVPFFKPGMSIGTTSFQQDERELVLFLK